MRTPDERRGDLAAQIAVNRTALRRMQELTDRWTFSTIEEHIDALIAYAERITRATIAAIPDGCYQFTDYLDNDGFSDTPIPIYAYPMRITAYRLREHSGGNGQWRGGDGLVHEITFEVPTTVILLTERRVTAL